MPSKKKSNNSQKSTHSVPEEAKEAQRDAPSDNLLKKFDHNWY